MSEFSLPGAEPISAAPPPLILGTRFGWLSHPFFLGLSLPWLVAAVLAVVVAGWYLFAPEGTNTPTVNQLAFNEGSNLQPVSSEYKASASVNDSPGLSQVQDQVAVMVGGVRSFAEANRTAIERLVQTTKALGAQLAVVQQQVLELQAQNSLLSAQLSSKGSTPVTAHRRAQPAAVAPSSPLAEMHLSAVQLNMAWVYWQEKTWAVQVGDRLGAVTVTGIDANNRQVRTSAGTLK
ncbi:conjugal transfer protein TraP [Pseudomonas sp. AA4]|uniref:conjugal transfer protein TraP n=1 Tax=unclassified Pseudomonas TaxID=196821 RepID=UPI002B22C490|nr:MULTISPECIES: conjugal transfer protein TraP [unclassified Pseudomonas]MEA9996481.1 conjugal transfer protein TraP [Pseudomonas sp. AA4]MEB0222082.1 conjugal transfer protein TraP [Pseudomonas sp. AB12(2023)]